MTVRLRVIAAAMAALATTGEASAAVLDAYRWRARPLLVFAPDGASSSLARQRALLQQAAADLRERDVVVLVVVGDAVTTAAGGATADRASRLRGRFGVPPGAFRVVLVGKDGGAKRSSAQPIPASELFRTIDAMPMRREEMRQR